MNLSEARTFILDKLDEIYASGNIVNAVVFDVHTPIHILSVDMAIAEDIRAQALAQQELLEDQIEKLALELHTAACPDVPWDKLSDSVKNYFLSVARKRIVKA